MHYQRRDEQRARRSETLYFKRAAGKKLRYAIYPGATHTRVGLNGCINPGGV